MNHVAFVIPGIDSIGGAERQVMVLAEGIRRRGWRVTVIALSGLGGVAADELRDADVEFLSLGMRKGLLDPRGWMRFHRWLRRERPDVVHSHLTHASMLARWSRLAAPVPVLIDTVHSSGTGMLRRRLSYASSRWLPDHVTAVSHAAAEAHRSAGMVCGENLSVLPNGIDVETWKPDALNRSIARRERNAGHEFLWLAVGRLDAVKDYSTLLRSMVHVPEPSHLAILGAGPLLTPLTNMVAQLGLNHRVQFLGFDPKVKHWMQAADGFVLSSRYEGLPMVLLEAGACEVPAVATDVSGTREVITAGKNGLLAPPADPESLARAMTKLMHMQKEERSAMGRCARKMIVERYSMHAVLDRWEQLYTELLDRKSGRRWTALSIRESRNRQSATPSWIRSNTDNAEG